MSTRLLLALAVLHGIVAAVFFADTGPGFPLDDAWLHMVYARSFGHGTGFSYNPGQFETGVTAPLWTALLAVPVTLAELLGQRPDLGVRVLAGATGVLLAASGFRLASRAGRWPAAFAAVLLTADPLLVFDRYSGMELPLFGLLSLAWVGALLDGRESRVGLLSGAATLSRPEGLLLVLLAGIWLLRERRRLAPFLGPVLLCLLPWALYCQLAGGRPWPATVENKVAFALAPTQVGTALAALWHGTGWGWALLVAAFVGTFSLEGGQRHLGRVIVLAATLLLAGVLASRELLVAGEPPRVPYYWARYVQIVWPLILVLAAAGLAAIFRTAYAGAFCRPLYAAILIAPLALVLLLGRKLPAQAPVVRARFAAECAQTEEQNVAAGRWVAAHLPVDALVATHDAGAIRYFGDRRVLDLWGNHSGELQLVLRSGDVEATSAWLRRQRPDALAVFPAVWAPRHYPALAEISRSLPPSEGRRLAELAAAADDWADLFGLTQPAATFRVERPATVPSPLHADLTIFVRP